MYMATMRASEIGRVTRPFISEGGRKSTVHRSDLKPEVRTFRTGIPTETLTCPTSSMRSPSRSQCSLVSTD
jgi:hypothetical protein